MGFSDQLVFGYEIVDGESLSYRDGLNCCLRTMEYFKDVMVSS